MCALCLALFAYFSDMECVVERHTAHHHCVSHTLMQDCVSPALVPSAVRAPHVSCSVDWTPGNLPPVTLVMKPSEQIARRVKVCVDPDIPIPVAHTAAPELLRGPPHA